MRHWSQCGQVTERLTKVEGVEVADSVPWRRGKVRW